MARKAKSAKKFAQKHLKSAIAQRRRLKPMKKAMKKKSASFSPSGKTNPEQDKMKLSKKDVTNMSVDEFLDGKFSDSDLDDIECAFEDEGDNDLDQNFSKEDNDDDFVDITPTELQEDSSEDDDGDDEGNTSVRSQNKKLLSEVQRHKKQLERLKEKDPEFFQFLEEHDQELLEFDDDDDDGAEEGMPEESSDTLKNEGAASASRLSISLVDTWCKVIKEKHHMGTVCNLLRAFRTACHYGDGEDNEFENKYSITGSHVFNKIMYFTLTEMDNVFRHMLGMEAKSGKADKGIPSFDPEKFPRWKKVEPLVKSYLGNTLHILNQMTDNHMISFTLQRIRASMQLLVALPRFVRKYLKVAIQLWGRGEGLVSLASFFLVREMALHLMTDNLDACLKGIYKEYAANVKFVNASSLPRIQFMSNCVVELYGIDLGASYQHAFLFIRQLAIILRNALTMKTKDSYKNVYSWQHVNCLEIWVKTLCTYADKKDLEPLIYPVTQIVTGVARLVPTARYFPLRLQCVKMLNKLASATNVYIPVAELILDMLEFKELRRAPTGGVGKSIDFSCVLKVSKPIVKTRAFQDECVASAIEQFAEHMAHWSYAIAFPELALVPLTGLRRFIKETKVDRFRHQAKQLVDHIEMNIGYVGRKRDNVNFSPKDTHLVAEFLQDEKKAGSSPLSKFAISLKQKADQRRSSLHASSVLMKGGNATEEALTEEQLEQEDANIFKSDWLPVKKPKMDSSKSRTKPGLEMVDVDLDAEDIVEDLEFSSDDDTLENRTTSDRKVLRKTPNVSDKPVYGSFKKERANDLEDFSNKEREGKLEVRKPKTSLKLRHESKRPKMRSKQGEPRTDKLRDIGINNDSVPESHRQFKNKRKKKSFKARQRKH